MRIWFLDRNHRRESFSPLLSLRWQGAVINARLSLMAALHWHSVSLSSCAPLFFSNGAHPPSPPPSAQPMSHSWTPPSHDRNLATPFSFPAMTRRSDNARLQFFTAGLRRRRVATVLMCSSCSCPRVAFPPRSSASFTRSTHVPLMNPSVTWPRVPACPLCLCAHMCAGVSRAPLGDPGWTAPAVFWYSGFFSALSVCLRTYSTMLCFSLLIPSTCSSGLHSAHRVPSSSALYVCVCVCLF